MSMLSNINYFNSSSSTCCSTEYVYVHCAAFSREYASKEIDLMPRRWSEIKTPIYIRKTHRRHRSTSHHLGLFILLSPSCDHRHHYSASTRYASTPSRRRIRTALYRRLKTQIYVVLDGARGKMVVRNLPQRNALHSIIP